jgi:hypothetical protein
MHTKFLFGESKAQRRPGRINLGWESNIKIVLTVIWCENVDWIYPAKDAVQWRAVVNTLPNSRVILRKKYILTR